MTELCLTGVVDVDRIIMSHVTREAFGGMIDMVLRTYPERDDLWLLRIREVAPPDTHEKVVGPEVSYSCLFRALDFYYCFGERGGALVEALCLLLRLIHRHPYSAIKATTTAFLEATGATMKPKDPQPLGLGKRLVLTLRHLAAEYSSSKLMYLLSEVNDLTHAGYSRIDVFIGALLVVVANPRPDVTDGYIEEILETILSLAANEKPTDPGQVVSALPGLIHSDRLMTLGLRAADLLGVEDERGGMIKEALSYWKGDYSNIARLARYQDRDSPELSRALLTHYAAEVHTLEDSLLFRRFLEEIDVNPYAYETHDRGYWTVVNSPGEDPDYNYASLVMCMSLVDTGEMPDGYNSMVVDPVIVLLCILTGDSWKYGWVFTIVGWMGESGVLTLWENYFYANHCIGAAISIHQSVPPLLASILGQLSGRFASLGFSVDPLIIIQKAVEMGVPMEDARITKLANGVFLEPTRIDYRLDTMTNIVQSLRHVVRLEAPTLDVARPFSSRGRFLWLQQFYRLNEPERRGNREACEAMDSLLERLRGFPL